MSLKPRDAGRRAGTQARRRTEGEMCKLGLSIPLTLRARMESESPASNWSAIATAAFEAALDKAAYLSDSLVIRVSALEAKVRMLEETKL